jgi:hypothetical protein
MSQVVLDAFSTTIKSEVKRSADRPQDASAAADDNLKNQAPVANE